jgi:hypothetical protein
LDLNDIFKKQSRDIAPNTVFAMPDKNWAKDRRELYLNMVLPPLPRKNKRKTPMNSAPLKSLLCYLKYPTNTLFKTAHTL